MGLEVEILAGLGIFFGCLGRTILPFLRKKYEAAERDDDVRWEGRYTWTIIFSLFISAVVTMVVLPTFQLPGQFVFPLAFSYGWAQQDIINTLVK